MQKRFFITKYYKINFQIVRMIKKKILLSTDVNFKTDFILINDLIRTL